MQPFSFLNHQESVPPPVMFIVCGLGGNIARTFDRGDTWSFSNLGSGDLRKIAYGDGVWVIVGNGRILRSPNNGINWSVTTITGNWYDVTFIPEISRFVAIRNNSNQFAYSDDLGQTWTTGTVATNRIWQGIAYGNGTLVAVASNTSGVNFNYSTNYGASWTAYTQYNTGSWHSIDWLNDRFVGTYPSGAAKASYSVDGITNWTGIPTGLINTKGAAYYPFPTGLGIPRYICVGNSIIGSGNGIVWNTYGTVPTAETNNYQDIASGDDTMIGVGLTGTNRTVRSFTGLGWHTAASLASIQPMGIASGEVV